MRFPFILLACLTGLAGCSNDTRPKRIPVSGVITLNGSAVNGGVICFQPADGRQGESNQPAFGVIDGDGKYSLTTFDPQDGAIAGRYNVAIESSGSTSAQYDPNAVTRSVLPLHYANAKASGLTASVPAEETRLEKNFHLTEP